MKHNEISRLLHDVDEQTVEEISQRCPGLTEEDKDRLYGRIQERLAQTAFPVQEAVESTCEVQEAPRFEWVRQVLPAVACLAVIAGTFAGLVAMNRRMPVRPEESELTAATKAAECFIGERFAAENLTNSGTLWVRVEDAALEDDLFHVTLTLESENAVSLAGTAEKQYTFYADNFMAATAEMGGLWDTTAPCRIASDQMTERNALVILPGERRQVELWFSLAEQPTEWRLVTSHSTQYPCAIID